MHFFFFFLHFLAAPVRSVPGAMVGATRNISWETQLWWAVAVAQLVECSSRRPKVLCSFEGLCKPGKVAHASNSNTWSEEELGSEIQGHCLVCGTWGLRSALNRWGPPSPLLNRSIVNSVRCKNEEELWRASWMEGPLKQRLEETNTL